MMRKTYNKPVLSFEVFTAQEFCVPCITDVVYSLNVINANCVAVYDFNQDSAWGEKEAQPGNIKNINPHGETLYFTEAARDKVMGMLYNSQVFYNLNGQDALINAAENNKLGYGIAIKPNVMSGATNPKAPVDAKDIDHWDKGAGNGVLAFNMEEVFHKNRS